MRTTTRLWKDFYPRMGEVDIKRPLDNEIIKHTMRPWEYRDRAKEILKLFNIKGPVLEIGCGFGGLAKEILKRRKVAYTVVDNKPMLEQAKKLLGNKVTYIDAKNIRSLRYKKFDLFVSYFCLSETPFKYREYVLKNIMKSCKKVAVMDYEDKQEPSESQIKKGYEMLPAVTEHFLNKYFVIEKKQFCRHKSFYLFTGTRKKMDIEDAEKTFLDVRQILNRAKIEFYLSDGTMLGAKRNGGIIPWDDDIDLRISASDWDFDLFKELENDGFECKASKNRRRYKDLLSGINLKKKGIPVGIGFNYYYPPEDAVVFLAGKPSGGSLQPARFYRENYSLKFLNVWVRVPFPPAEYLDRIYGPYWKNPIEGNGWKSFRKPLDIKKYVTYFQENPEVNE